MKESIIVLVAFAAVGLLFSAPKGLEKPLPVCKEFHYVSTPSTRNWGGVIYPYEDVDVVCDKFKAAT